jgi:hypothetical protein
MRRVAVDLAVVIGNHMLRRGLLLSVEGHEVVGELLWPSDEEAVVVDCIGMVGREQHLSIHPVDAAAIAHDHVVDRLAIEEVSQLVFERVLAHGGPPGGEMGRV